MTTTATAAAPIAPTSTPDTTASTPNTTTPPTQAQVARMIKMKVDGQEMELPESEIIALAQQGKSANKRFQEAAAAKREAEQVVNFLKSNPKEAFKKLGIDVRKFSEDTLLEFIQQEQMSPEQRKAHENEQELNKYRESEKSLKAQREAQERETLEKHHHDNYEKIFIQALTESGLPKTPYTVMRMAQLEAVNVSKKLSLTPSQLAKVVREDYINEQKALYGAADGETLLELLGKDAVKKLSKAQLSKYKASAQNSGTFKSKTSTTKETQENPISAWKAMQKKTRSLL